VAFGQVQKERIRNIFSDVTDTTKFTYVNGTTPWDAVVNASSFFGGNYKFGYGVASGTQSYVYWNTVASCKK